MTPLPAHITSRRNPAVAAVARLHRVKHRRVTGLSVIEGPQLVEEAIDNGVKPKEIYGLDDDDSARLASRAGIPLVTVSEPVLRKLSATETPQGPVAVIDIPQPAIPPNKRLLVAWGVADPGNCGTMLRSAAAFGYAYASGPGSADVWSPKVLRSAAGGHFQTEIGIVSTLEDLSGRLLVGTVAEGGEVPGPVAQNAAVIIGSEARGLPSQIVDACDRLMTIPMPGGTESLNAAVAGAIVAYLGTLSTHD